MTMPVIVIGRNAGLHDCSALSSSPPWSPTQLILVSVVNMQRSSWDIYVDGSDNEDAYEGPDAEVDDAVEEMELALEDEVEQTPGGATVGQILSGE